MNTHRARTRRTHLHHSGQIALKFLCRCALFAIDVVVIVVDIVVFIVLAVFIVVTAHTQQPHHYTSHAHAT
jgi:hypothetical protein